MEFICRDCGARMYAEGGVWDETTPVKVIPCKCLTDKLRAQIRVIEDLKAEVAMWGFFEGNQL